MRISNKMSAAIAGLAFVGAAAAQQERIIVLPDDQRPIVVRTDRLPDYVARQLAAESDKGLRAVRQYVLRTRFIHQLDLVDVLMTPEQARQVAAAEPDARFVALTQLK